MQHFIGGLVVLTAFFLANVVAAGVYLVLWPLLEPRWDNEIYKFTSIVLIGALAAACAVFFFKGFTSSVLRWFK